MIRRKYIFTSGILLLLLASCVRSTDDPMPISQEAPEPEFMLYEIPVTDSLKIANTLRDAGSLEARTSQVADYYRRHDWQCIWFGPTGVKEQAGYFINLLRQLPSEGINDSIMSFSRSEALYHMLSSPAYRYTGGNDTTLQFEHLLTAQFFEYAERVYQGLNESKRHSLNWFIRKEDMTLDNLLDSLVLKGPEAFMSAAPLHPQYKLLRQAANELEPLLDAEWPELVLRDSVKYLYLGDSSELVASLQYRLHMLGDLDSIITTGVYDSATVTAVRRFQRRHGLQDDGQAGRNFLGELNISPAHRIEQIHINMERYRWVPRSPEDEYIIVNIPAFRMYIYDADTLSWTMGIIVGANSTSTTIFNDDLEYIVFSPYWIVPESIIRNEIVPGMIKDSTYLSRHRMELFRYSDRKTVVDPALEWSKYRNRDFPYGIRQLPGAGNSLGWVKFLFPNQYYIYFHDTPTKNLFSLTQRNFSHGCIRLSEPRRLAAYLLRHDSLWTDSYLDSVMYSLKETTVPLPESIPVIISYFTSWVDEDGVLQFRKDIYGHDRRLLDAMVNDSLTLTVSE